MEQIIKDKIVKNIAEAQEIDKAIVRGQIDVVSGVDMIKTYLKYITDGLITMKILSEEAVAATENKLKKILKEKVDKTIANFKSADAYDVNKPGEIIAWQKLEMFRHELVLLERKLLEAEG